MVRAARRDNHGSTSNLLPGLKSSAVQSGQRHKQTDTIYVRNLYIKDLWRARSLTRTFCYISSFHLTSPQWHSQAPSLICCGHAKGLLPCGHLALLAVEPWLWTRSGILSIRFWWRPWERKGGLACSRSRDHTGDCILGRVHRWLCAWLVSTQIWGEANHP